MAAKISGLISDHCIGCRMGLVESVGSEIGHFIKDRFRNFRADSLGNTSGHILFRIAVDEVMPFGRHNIRFFLGHGTAHQIGTSHRISGQIPHDLHNLFLIDHASVSRIQNRFQERCLILDMAGILLAFKILRNKIHRAGSVQRDPGDDIFHVLWSELPHELCHAGTFQLEDTVSLAGADHLINFRIVHGDPVHIQADPFCLINVIDCVLNYGERSKAKEVHLQKSQFFEGVHGIFRDDVAVIGTKRHKFHRFITRDQYAGRMGGSMPRQSFEPHRHLDQFADLIVAVIDFLQFRIAFQGFLDRHLQLIRNHLGDLVNFSVGKIHDPSDIPDDQSGRHRTESYDLSDPVRAVLSGYIVDDFLASSITEICINIRHGNTFRIEQTFEQQVITQRFHGRDIERIGHQGTDG